MTKKINIKKINKLLNRSWVMFNANLCGLTIEELRVALQKEMLEQKRSTFIARIKSRIRRLAAKAAI